MALIGKIRSNMWVVFVIIALATLSFILMDAQGPGGGQVGDTTLGVVNGKKIDYRDFDLTERVLFSNSAQEPLMRRAGLWDYFVNKTIVEEEAEEIGMTVSQDELMELQFGQSLSPIIYQNYRNPQTGQIDIQQLTQIKNAIISNSPDITPSFRQYWAEQEKQVISTQLQTKLNNIVQKGLYTPTWLAEEAYKDQNSTMNLEVVKIPFDDIDGSDVTLTDSDFQSYITKNKADLETKEETRVIDYVTMDVYPNKLDSVHWEGEMNKLIANFQTSTNDSLFAFGNKGSYQNYYARGEEIQESIRDIVPGMAVGSVYGPYVSQRNYQAVKLVDRKVIPDSVQASHILIRAVAGDAAQLARAHTLIDSLMAVVGGRSSFANLAETFSEDLSNKDKGGDLGYFAQGAMVPAFNDACFVTGREGGVYKVQTQFGVHMIRINDKVFNSRTPKHKLAYINVPIIPTKETQDNLYGAMTELVGEYSYLEDLIEKVNNTANLEMSSSNPVGQNDYSIDLLGPGNTTREIIKFAFEESTDAGDLSPQVYSYTDEQLYYVKRYVIAGLARIQEPGLPAIADIKADAEIPVMNNKKAEKYISGLGSKGLSSIAADANIEIDTILNASLNSTFIAGLGNEPKVLGAVSKLAAGTTSAPIIGESGVFVIKKIADNNPGEATGLVSLKSSISTQEKGAKSFKLINAIKEKSTIKDNRATFF